MHSIIPKSLYSSTTLLFLFLLNVNCGNLKSSSPVVTGINSRISLDYDGPEEPEYCAGTINYVNGITISGTANYEYRELEYTSQLKGMGDVAEEAKPIRRAEFVVINNIGTVVQCGHTNSNGGFTFTLPNNGQVHRLQIRSRSDTEYFKASVMRSPESNYIYNLEAAFSANSNQTINLTAPAKGSVLGGAFFIMDEIYHYNIRLRQLAGTCPALGCVPFTVAPKVAIYWEKGFNPGSYLQGSPEASFYYRNKNRLFILGGSNGDVNFSDTDHFDRSIIAHEYFHFLEDTYSKSDSPGGNHNGNELLDPRLAWSEGVAQFFQAAVTNVSRVLDSVGNVDGATQLIVDYTIEGEENDIPEYEGEGEFREFSVARLLWDLHDDTPTETNSSLDCDDSNISTVHDMCAKNGFPQFWAVITGTGGFNNTSANHRFVSSGLFHQIHRTIATGSSQNLQPLRVVEKQYNSRERYGTRLRTTGCGTADTISIESPFETASPANFANSHPVANKRYLYIQHSGGPLAVRMVSSLTGTGFSAQADLYLYPENHTLDGTTPLAANTNNTNSKSLSLSNVPAGFYMIVANVRNFNSATGSVDLTFQAGADLSSLGALCVTP